jgi:ferric-dicitrate binding protein FerR (iron transport regulator)
MKQQDRDRNTVDSDAAVELLLLAGPRKQVPPEREQRALAEVEEHWQRRVAARRRRRNRVLVVASLAAAASLLMAVLVRHRGPIPALEVATVEVVHGSLLSVGEGWHELAVGASIAAGSTIATEEHDRAALRLLDGASLRLDVGTRLTFEAKELARLERGAVYIDSGAESELGTLTVSTALGEVNEVGTQYEVRLLEDALRVRVREGWVALQREQGAAEEIRAGQELLMQAEGELQWREIGATDPGWAWLIEVAPPFHLPGSSAAAFLRWVQRENGYVLRWAEPTLAGRAEKIILQGDITGVRPDEAANLVLPTCGLSHRLEEGVLIVDIMPTR